MNQLDLLRAGSQALRTWDVLRAFTSIVPSRISYAGQMKSKTEYRVTAYWEPLPKEGAVRDRRTTAGDPLAPFAFCDLSSVTGEVLLLEKLYDPITCQKCGSARRSMVEQAGHLQTFRCDDCGELDYSRIYPADEVVIENPVRVRFTWRHAEPTVRDAAALRHLSMAAAELSLTVLLCKLRSEKLWDAGVHSRFHASELREKAAKHNIQVEFEEARWDVPPKT
jgi:hypothetical protein